MHDRASPVCSETTRWKPGWEKKQDKSTPGSQLPLLKVREAKMEVHLPERERVQFGRLREQDADLKN